jgi:hypothetical protein
MNDWENASGAVNIKPRAAIDLASLSSLFQSWLYQHRVARFPQSMSNPDSRRCFAEVQGEL